MGGSIKWPYNDSECLDADFFKVALIGQMPEYVIMIGCCRL